MCFFKKTEPKPEIELSEVQSGTIFSELGNLGLQPLYSRLDSKYYQPTDEGWAEALLYIYKTQEVPIYTSDTMDCEDFAMWLKVMLNIHFHINTCAFVIGDIPQGKHGFNLLRLSDGWYVWEPQPSFDAPFTIGTHGYEPEVYLI